MAETLWGCTLLALALSMDTFAAGLALGTQQIKIPFCSALALGLTCSFSLWAAVWLGDAAGGWMSVRTASLLGGGVLVVMGSVRLCDGLLKNVLKKCCERENAWVFRIKNLRIFLQESLAGMLVIRVFGKEKQIVENANEKMAGHKKARMRRNHISNLCNSGFNGAMNVAYVVGTAVGGYGILTGTITYGTLMAMIQLIGQLQSPFASLTGFFPQYYGMLASAERIREIEEYPVDQIGGEKKTAEQIQEFYRKKLKGLVLKDAKFSYISSESDQKDTRPVVLEHINLEIPKGVYVALTGPSGCGKSTLLKVLMCLYHLDQGEYQLKVETQTEPMTSKWRSLFAYVP